ncbi:MAG: hypothetical protein LC104_17230 [Bacteroidales bacterium]|nr:hypothetical protein [Bacteroidales bacterium]
MMTHREALAVLASHRADAIVIPSMGSVGIWPEFSDTPRDFHYLPSSMGQVVALALGLALSRPGLRVVALSGDGSLLMNPGCLVTLGCHTAPVTVILIENGLYEVTGGQPPAGVGRVDFAGLARASGIERVFAFDTLSEWEAGCREALAGDQPTFVRLAVIGERGHLTPSAPRRMPEQIARLRAELGIN